MNVSWNVSNVYITWFITATVALRCRWRCVCRHLREDRQERCASVGWTADICRYVLSLSLVHLLLCLCTCISGNFGCISYRFRDIDVWIKQMAHFPNPSLVWRPPIGSNALEFLDETDPAKTRGMGLPFGKNFIVLTYPFLTDPPIWQTDVKTDRWTGDSI